MKAHVFATAVAGPLLLAASASGAQPEVSEVSETTASTEETVPTSLGHPRAGNAAIGFELTDFQRDFGLGLNLTSPYFFKKTMALRLRGGIAWNEGIPSGAGDQNYQWQGYAPLRLGWVVSLGLGNGLTRLYAEAGGLLFLATDDIYSGVVVGGYGEFGFEFFPAHQAPVSYFIQAGGMGSSGKGSELVGQPGFANGFMLDVGIRFYPY